MSSQLDQFSRRLRSQAHAHRRALDTYARHRVKDAPDLDFAKLRGACDDYIGWCGDVVEAAHQSLSQRGLAHSAHHLAEKAQAVLDLAKDRPTQGPRGLPAVLRGAVVLHGLVLRLNQGESPIVLGDLQTPLQVALVLVAEADVVTIDAEIGELATAGAVTAFLDLAALDVNALASPPVAVPAFAVKPMPAVPEPVSAAVADSVGARVLSAVERSMAGHWVYEEYYGGGHSELHMALLPDGGCLRSARSMASLTFHDQMGNWTGHMGAASGLSPDEHGRWSCKNGLLNLDMADGSAYEYRVSLAGSSMMTENTSGGTRRLWTRQH